MNSVIRASTLSLLLGAATCVWSAETTIPIKKSQYATLDIQTAALKRAGEFRGSRLPAKVVIPPSQVRVVSAPKAGLITSLHAAVGDEVTADDRVARIESPELVALQRDYLQTLTRERLAKSETDRDRALFKEGIIAERRYRETRSAYLEAAAALDERRQALLMAGMRAGDIDRLRKERTMSNTLQVRAGLDGVVLERMVQTGQRVQASAPLYRIANLNPLWLDLRIPLSDVEGLSMGSPISVPGYPVQAELMHIGHEVDPDNQTVLVRARITEGFNALRPGQFVEAQVSSVVSADQYRVPSSAVVRAGERTVIFVQRDSGFEPVGVRLVSQQDNDAVIAGNLQGNEHVAVNGIAAIKGAWQGLGGE